MSTAVPPQQPGWGQPGFQGPGKPKRPWYKRKLVWALAAIIAIIAITSGNNKKDEPSTAVSDNTPTSTAAPAAPAPTKAAPPPSPAAPAPLVVSSQQLLDALKENALKAKNTYNGKTVTATGFVGNIDASGRYFSLLPEPDAIVFTGVQVYTSSKFKDQVANFSKNQPVTVTGKIDNVGEVMGYSLKADTIK